MSQDADVKTPLVPADEKGYREIIDRQAREILKCGMNMEASLSELKKDQPDIYDDVRERIDALKKCDELESGYTY